MPLLLLNLQVHVLIYSVVPSISIYMDFLLVSNYSMVDVLVVHIQILYYTHSKYIHWDNKTTITQLGTCVVELEHKNNKFTFHLVDR